MSSLRTLVLLLAFSLSCAAPNQAPNDPAPESEPEPEPESEAVEAVAGSGEYSASGFHQRPLIDREGRRLLWANDEEDGEQLWFDVTAASIDPVRFQFGIGKDTIPSIDEPIFVEVDDPRLEEAGIDYETSVLGVSIGGEARAYPVATMSRHEVVNDHFGGKPFAVLW